MRSMAALHQSLGRELSTAADNGPSLTSHQAAHAVFFTNELLCNIVGRLPFKDIVSATGLCKFWRKALQSTQHIQETLFLEPVEIREVVCEIHRLHDLEHSIEIDDCMVLCKTHPYIHDIICDEVQVPRRIEHRRGKLMKFQHPSGTWREMFLTQPPCKKATVHIGSTHASNLIKCANSTGVKLGELHDRIQSIHPPGSAYDVDVRVTVSGYADKDSMPRKDPSTTTCKVLHGEVCRPKELPTLVDPSEIERFDNSEDCQDEFDWDHDFDGTEECSENYGYDDYDFVVDDSEEDDSEEDDSE